MLDGYLYPPVERLGTNFECMYVESTVPYRSNHSLPNYRETIFEYPDQSVIHGEPIYIFIYISLQPITNQLKANAQLIHTNLGGDHHGHL